MRRSCKNCEFHVVDEDEDHYCYRYPPKLISINRQIQTEYPIVDPKVDWCGEFKPKPVEAVVEAEILEG